MKHVVIISHSGSNLGSIDNPRRAFLSVNEFFAQKNKSPLFKVSLVGIEKEISHKDGLFTLHCDFTINEIKKADLIVIPAIDGNIPQSIEKNQAFLPWLIEQYKNGAEIASLCVGAFLLASTGLLNGKNCSTHWRASDDFKKTFPEVHLITEKIITDENGIYTSGGAFSAANLILYLIEKYAGRDVSVHCSKMFQIDLDRQSQAPFIIFKGQKEHEDEQILQVQEYIEQNYGDKITVDELTNKLALSRRNLERRFKKATSNTVIEYIQRVRVEAVKKQLEFGRKTVSELMYEVGYSDTKAFRNLFRKITGLTPMEYRKKYN